MDTRYRLLEELDINPLGICRKIVWVVAHPWLPSRFGYSMSDDLITASPDFWGPLGLVIAYAALLLWGTFEVVPWVILIWVLGSALIRFVSQVSGSPLSLGQILACTGYSAAPLILVVLSLVVARPRPTLSLPLQALGIVWATRSGATSLVPSLRPRRKWLVVYPLLLLYTYLMSLYAERT
ncbi:unnamed protein product [Phaeothamnion confervicola]